MSTPAMKVLGWASPGFRWVLFGILVSLLAWFGPWSWPAWPAIATLELAFTPVRPFAALSYGMRSAVVVILIFVNVAGWALLARGFAELRERIWRNRG